VARFAARLVATLSMPVRFASEVRLALSNMAWKVFSFPLEKLCRFLLVAAAARALGTAPFGRFRFATTVTLLLALTMDLGMGMWTIRELARSRTRAATIARTVLRVRALSGLPYLFLIAIAALLSGPGETRVAISLLGVSGLASALIDHAVAVFRGHERFSDEAQVNVARAVLVLGAALVGMGLRRSLVGLTAGVMVGTVVAALYSLWILRRHYRLLLAGDEGGYDPALARTIVRDGVPIWLAGLVSMLYFKGDTVILKFFAGDAVLGAYSAAYQIFEGSMLVPAMLLAAAFPPLARAHLVRERQRQWERLVFSVLLVLGLAVGAVCYAARRPIIELVFHGGFAQAIPSLRILALGVPLLYVNYGLTHFLIARDLGQRNMAFSAMMLVLNVALNLVAIPRLGGPGAAWATVITEAALTLCCLVALQQPRDYRAPQPVPP
jgi:O-antigen/teichoic acid export membrane protein